MPSTLPRGLCAWAILTLSAVLFAGCAAAPERRGEPAPAGELRAEVQSVTGFARKLLGRPYRFGGAEPEGGFDCSGYVQYVFRQAVGMRLPRATDGQFRLGRPASWWNVRPADLVFFRIEGPKSLHVGIYLGERRFVHAPSSGGAVRVESLDDPFWKQRFIAGRRLL
jgi:cell wall-associated NlpC family hydrolase